MGILDMTDKFCDPLNQMSQINQMNSSNTNAKLGNKLHEQPIVSFVEKNNEQNVIYREEL